MATADPHNHDTLTRLTPEEEAPVLNMVVHTLLVIDWAAWEFMTKED